MVEKRLWVSVLRPPGSLQQERGFVTPPNESLGLGDWEGGYVPLGRAWHVCACSVAMHVPLTALDWLLLRSTTGTAPPDACAGCCC